MSLARQVSFPLREVVTGLLAGPIGQGWRLSEDEQWCHATPGGYRWRVQGWKLHVSATWLSAPVVLHLAAGVLVEHGCAFKFATTVERARAMTQKDTDRAQAGKFLTAYPRNDDHLRELAGRLDEATAGLPGPVILSDRPLRPGSLVHYRYGAFTGIPVLTNDGALEVRLEAPDGPLVEDVREPWFCPPAWAELPFGGLPGRAAKAPASPRPVLLGGRFRVTTAIRHSARGGVYRATDQQTGQEVVVKQARAHISGLSLAGDARDGLRYESAMLSELAGLAPAPVLLFEDGPHLFLAMEALDGEPLGGWVRRWWEEPPAGTDPEVEGPPVAEAEATAGRLADLLDAVHERGLVFRDLSSNNVLVLADGTLRLVDAELVARPGEWVSNAYTRGFAAPELLAGRPVGPAPGPAADHYALGALLCHLVAGQVPAFSPHDPQAGPPTSERIASLLAYAAPRNLAVRRLAPAVRGLTAEDPAQRWDTARLRALLASPDPDPVPEPGEGSTGRSGRLDPGRRRELVTGGLAHLAAAMLRAAPDRLVPSNEYGNRSDPCNVQYGAAGVLAVLVRASELLGGQHLRDAVAQTARWIDRRRLTSFTLLPGLYFGRSGTAWALYTAARHLDDGPLAERALELARALPVRWPNPDLTHGTAGAGLASLYLWYESKDPALLERVDIAVDHLAETVQHQDGKTYWRVDPEFDSKLAGLTHYGFAHGVAGIGAFLLAAAVSTGRSDARELAEQAGQTLAAATVRVAGGAYWPNDVAGPDPSDLRYYWCSGASGVGSFLLRLWQATGESRYRELAHEAAVMVRRGRWLTGVSVCHGLAGNGEFLLDLADATGDRRYQDWAEEVAACIDLRSARRDGRLVVVPDPLSVDLNFDFSGGLAGAVGFLLRLGHGGPRWWTVDAYLGLESPAGDN